MKAAPLPDRPYRHVPASRGAAWLGEGWRSFLRAPWAWLGLSLALLLLPGLMHALPLGGLLAPWLSMVLAALGAVFASELQQRWLRSRVITPSGQVVDADNEGALGESARQWRGRLGPLLAATLLVLALLVLGVLLAGALATLLLGIALFGPGGPVSWMFGMSTPMMGAMAGGGLHLGMLLMSGLVALPVLLLLGTLFWFVGTLVTLGGMGPWQAVRLSSRAALHNLGALVVFSLLLIPVGLLALIPMGLGVLVLIPVIAGASYASYVDVFGQAPARPPGQV